MKKGYNCHRKTYTRVYHKKRILAIHLTAYGNTKDAFLQHERWHIRTQKVAFRNVKGMLLQYNMCHLIL